MNLEIRVDRLENHRTRRKTVKEMTDEELIRIISDQIPGFGDMTYDEQTEAMRKEVEGCGR